MTALGEGSAQLAHRWIELLGYINVAKVVLTAQIVNRQPFNLSYLLSIRQRQREILVVIAIQNVGSTVGISIIYSFQFILHRNNIYFDTYLPYSSGTMNPCGPGRLLAPDQKNVSAPLPS